MIRRMVGAAALAVGCSMALVLGGSASWAQQPNSSQTLRLTPSRDSEVSGTATLTDTNGGVQVQLSVQDLPRDGAEHFAHIHSDATCTDDRADNGGPIEYPLESVTAQPDGTGSSTTMIPDVTLAQLFDGTKRYINVHAEQSGSGTPPGIACANLVSSATQGQTKKTEETVKMEKSQPLPSSGGAAVGLLLLPATGLLVGFGIFAYAVVRRRG